MIARRFLISLLPFGLFVPSVFSSTKSAQALLAASDEVRNPGRPFVTTITLTEFRAGRRVDGNTLVSYSRVLERDGQFATLLRFVKPTRDAGKLMLRNGNDMWFFDPNTHASVRLSPQQRDCYGEEIKSQATGDLELKIPVALQKMTDKIERSGIYLPVSHGSGQAA